MLLSFSTLSDEQFADLTDEQFAELETDNAAPVRQGESFYLTAPTVVLNGDATLLGELLKVDGLTYRYDKIASARRPVTVTMSSDAGTEIRYTLNGKSPTHNSTLYTNPLSLSQSFYGVNVTIKARAYRVVDGKISPNDKSPLVVARFGIRK